MQIRTLQKRVRITRCGNSQNFSATWILREINFGELRSCKTAILAILGAVNFWYFGKYLPSKSAKIHENQNSEPLNVLKWQILHF